MAVHLSAHAPSHMTCEQGLKQLHIWVHDSNLTIHYSTFMGHDDD